MEARCPGCIFSDPGFQFISAQVESREVTMTNLIGLKPWGKAKADGKTSPAFRPAAEDEVPKRKTEPHVAAPLRDNLAAGGV
jgi:hypothetical protein